jgi:plastocyanin
MRRCLLVVGLIAIGVFAAAPARAGGGCHGGVASGSGATVELSMNCMNPRVLRVDGTSAEVTFVNRDHVLHNVSGDGWGVDELSTGQATTQRFGEGTHVYACTFHPGMVGAIVVGDGVGSAIAAATPVRAVSPAASPNGSSAGWLFGMLVGLVVGVIATFVTLRARLGRPER